MIRILFILLCLSILPIHSFSYEIYISNWEYDIHPELGSQWRAPGGGLAANDFLYFKVRRVLGSDNLSDNIQLKGVDVCYRRDGISD